MKGTAGPSSLDQNGWLRILTLRSLGNNRQCLFSALKISYV